MLYSQGSFEMVYKTNNEVLEGFNYVIQATKSKD